MHRFEADIPTRPRLNFDILHLVCNSLTEIPDVLSVALTCSGLAVLAFQRRLKMFPIHLSNVELVDSFHRFIFANEAARAPYIYGLKLLSTHRLRHGESPDPRLQAMHDRLVAILNAAIHLEYIYFPTTLDLDPVLTAAANMTSLRELHMVFAAFGGDSKWSPWKLLGTFRSPLRSLRIDSTYDSADEAFPVTLIHDHLASFAGTLEVLEVHSIDFDDFPFPITTQFTALRSFITHTVLDFNESTMEVLLRLFPNLDDTLILGFIGVMDTEHDHPTLREWNREEQQARAWSGFNHVSCEVRLAFLMGLQCPIRRMHITVLRSYGRGLLKDVLRDSCPRFLHLSLLFNNSLRDLDGLFPGSEAVVPLTHLVVFVDVEGREGRRGKPISVPWDPFMDKLLDSMKHLSLTHLRIVFHYTGWYKASQDPFTIQELDAIYTLGEEDLRTVANRVFVSMPTVRYVLLATCGHTYQSVPRNEARPGAGMRTLKKWHISKAWRAADPLAEGHSSTTGSPVTLSEEATENIVAREELHFSSDEEDKIRRCGDVTARKG